MVVVERIPQPVTDHRVDILHVAHLVPGAQCCGMGTECHVFLTTSSDDVSVTQLNMLGTQRDSPQTGPAHLIDPPGGGFLWQACIDMCLTGRVLPLGSGQHLTQNCFANLRFVDARARDHLFQNGGTQIMGGCIGKCATKAAHGGACGRCDNNVGHEFGPLQVISLAGRGQMHVAGASRSPLPLAFVCIV